MKAAHYIEPK